jgi:hypothetical protein
VRSQLAHRIQLQTIKRRSTEEQAEKLRKRYHDSKLGSVHTLHNGPGPGRPEIEVRQRFAEYPADGVERTQGVSH